jgi:hypothetical protein
LNFHQRRVADGTPFCLAGEGILAAAAEFANMNLAFSENPVHFFPFDLLRANLGL